MADTFILTERERLTLARIADKFERAEHDLGDRLYKALREQPRATERALAGFTRRFDDLLSTEPNGRRITFGEG